MRSGARPINPSTERSRGPVERVRHGPERHARVEMGIVDPVEMQPGAPSTECEVLECEAVQHLRLDDRGEPAEPPVVGYDRGADA